MFICLFYIPGILLGIRDEKVNKTDTFTPTRVISMMKTTNKLAIIVWSHKFHGSTSKEHQTQIWGFRLEATSGA